MKLRLAAALAAVTAGALLTGCTDAGADDGRPTVVASFYPLQFVAERVAGDHADVRGLTPPGAEPHDLELTAKDVAAVADAGLVVYLRGFQPSVDEAVDGEAGGAGLDVAPAARLDRPVGEAAVEGTQGEEPEGVGGHDPHFWLDPTRLGAVAGLVAERLAGLDPAAASTYRANAAGLTAELGALDAELRAGLATCASKDLVTSHQAFGYLADRYGLTQVGITGLSPDAEPEPADLARVTDHVRTHRVRTIYYETLVSPAVARTVAAETGARTAVLDPLEGLTEDSDGGDYLAVMRSNLQQLREGQPCP